MKKLAVLIAMTMAIVCLLTGCTGTIVVINECDCPEATQIPSATPAANESASSGIAGSLPVKTGLSVSVAVGDSISAAEGQDGAVKYDVTIVAVTVDDRNVITACYIDSIPATVNMDATGAILSDITAEVPTKNELGPAYGMVAWGKAKAEWNEQAAALAGYAVGKTVEELKNGAIDETGRAPEGSDLASSASIYLGGYVSAIEAAVNNAHFAGAQAGDTLTVATINSLKNSVAATAEANGTAQLDADIAVVTSNNGVITSCIIDSVQAKISFDAAGVITTDLTTPILTKNELGANYGMVAWGKAKAEWNEQAAAFAAYVTGKTADEVAGIAINEATKPADGSDLASSVTISIGGFQGLIEKAMK
ncbi:MAG: hypothetical protein E7335_03135 [Clostridiales bacterium]|nr:hypothetical protein [Clostridiales bacterium]